MSFCMGPDKFDARATVQILRPPPSCTPTTSRSVVQLARARLGVFDELGKAFDGKILIGRYDERSAIRNHRDRVERSARIIGQGFE